jgi:hypothetical protein
MMANEPHEQPPEADDTIRIGDLLAAIRRIEKRLGELHGSVEALVRERQHREFSIAALAGSLLQVVVVGFLFAALADWIYGGPPARQLVKIGFAAVLQLGALTAFFIARTRA